jgi:hypothetical protein
MEPKHEKRSAANEAAKNELLKWQSRLLPFMTTFIVVMAAAFFFFSGWHVYQVTTFLETEHGENIRALIQNQIANANVTSDSALQHSVLLLEADTLDKRYHQASALLMARIWSRQLAFVTGMVMAFVGAIFILGKFSESESQASGGGGDWKVAITSASPGIILSFFGTTLLISSLFVRASLDVADGPAYLNALHQSASQSTPSRVEPSRPLDLNDFQTQKPNESSPKSKPK